MTRHIAPRDEAGVTLPAPATNLCQALVGWDAAAGRELDALPSWGGGDTPARSSFGPIAFACVDFGNGRQNKCSWYLPSACY